MVTRSAPPDLDVVEAAIRGIVPFLRRDVERHVAVVAATVTTSDQNGSAVTAGETGLPGLDADPLYYAAVLTMVGVRLEPGSLAEELWNTARVLVATNLYCVRLDPRAAERKQVLASGGNVSDSETVATIDRRYRANRPMLDDAEEYEFVAVLEQLARASLKAQQATADKLAFISKQPVLLESAELEHRERVMAWFRATISEMVRVADAEFGSREGIAFPRSRRAWQDFVACAGAELNARGLSHHEVATIFHGNDLGAVSSTPRVRAKERARLRTVRAQLNGERSGSGVPRGTRSRRPPF